MTDSQSLASNGGRSRRRDRRSELIAASRKLFLDRGFRDTSVSAIVREAGVAQGTFYLYFQSKPEVLLYMRAEVLEDYLAAFEDGMSGEERADVRLACGLRAIDSAVDRNRPLIRLFRTATTSDELQRVWIEGRAALARPLSALIGQGCRDGSFQVDDPRMASLLGLALFDDLLYEAYEYGTPAEPQNTLTQGTRFLLRALGATPGRIDELVPLEKHR